MLSARHRLRRRSDFVQTVRSGRRAQRPAVVGHLLVDSGAAVPGSGAGVRGSGAAVPASGAGVPVDQAADPARVGFVVSRAVGGAVQRNRVRRRLRHLMRDRVRALPAGASLVVRAQRAAAGSPGADLARDLDGVLARLARPVRGSGR